VTPRRKRRLGAGIVAHGRLDTRRRVCSGHSKCRVIATCVRDPGPGERPDGRRRSSSVPGCGSTFAVVHGTLAGRTRESKKNFCCVTTRCRIFGVLRYLGRRLGTLAAHALRLRLPRFGGGIQATAGLSLGRLPAADLPLTIRLLAVTLVPTPWLVLPSAAFTQADPRSGLSSRSSTARALWFILVGAHGSRYLPRESSGRTRERSSRALIQNPELAQGRPVYLRQKEGDREGNSFRKDPEEPNNQEHAGSRRGLALRKRSVLALCCRSVPESEKTEVSTRAASSRVSVSATEEPKSNELNTLASWAFLYFTFHPRPNKRIEQR
jgi:hypothetical protein